MEKMINKGSFMVLLFLIIMNLHGCKFIKLESEWSGNKIAIDGDYQDWEGIPTRFLEDDKIVVGVANDSDNLYCMVRFTDLDMLWKIQNLGVTLWLDSTFEQIKTYGVCYTGSADFLIDIKVLNMGLPPEDPNKKQSFGAMRGKLKGDAPDLSNILIISDTMKTEISELQDSGPAAGSQNHNGVFCYEFRIPLICDVDHEHDIAFGIETGGFDLEAMEMMKNDRGQRGKMGNPGMGGGPGMGGDHGMGGKPDMENDPGRRVQIKRFEKQKIWFKVVLAENK